MADGKSTVSSTTPSTASTPVTSFYLIFTLTEDQMCNFSLDGLPNIHIPIYGQIPKINTARIHPQLTMKHLNLIRAKLRYLYTFLPADYLKHSIKFQVTPDRMILNSDGWSLNIPNEFPPPAPSPPSNPPIPSFMARLQALVEQYREYYGEPEYRFKMMFGLCRCVFQLIDHTQKHYLQLM